MVELSVTIKLKEPLLVGGIYPSATDQVLETMRYIPGGTLRGAVGTRLARIGHHDQHPGQIDAGCPFCRVFLAGAPPRFGPCYPVGSETSESRPLPATARTCKHHPGFKIDEDAHGIRDILFRQWAVEIVFETSRRLPQAYPFRCACNADLEPIGGVYEQVDVNFFQPQVWVQRFSRTAIDRRRHVAADELLYTLEVLNEEMDSGRPERDHGRKSQPTIFRGRVWLEAEADMVAEALHKMDRLGGDTSRGLGAVQVQVDKKPLPAINIAADRVSELARAAQSGDFDQVAPKNDTDLVARLARFNARLRRVAGEIGAPVPPGSLFFSLDLLSDAVWTENGLPATLLPETLAGARRVRSWAAARTHGGWHTAAGMMRRTYLAINAGSVFLYQLDDVSDPVALCRTLETWASLERDGFGQERERGYGWIEICSPFHLEVEPR